MGDRLAGRLRSRAVYRTWFIITTGIPARTRSRNGRTSVRRRVSSVTVIGSAASKWMSSVERPWPGKCLATGRTPPSAMPSA